MADLAAKRDARRRRILENSENRISKITGVNIAEIPEDKNPLLEIPHLSPPLETTKTDRENAEVETPESEVENPEASEVSKLIHQNASCCEPPPPKYNSPNRTSTKSTLEPQNAPLQKLAPIYFLIVALAVIANICMTLNASYFHGQTIVVPYAVLITTNMIFGKQQEDESTFNWLGIILFLLKVDVEMISRVKFYLNKLKSVVRDFALYLFSFVLVRFVFSQCFSVVEV